MRPSRPTAIRSKKNSCGDRHARRREAERRSRQSSLVLVDDRQPPMTRSGRRGQGAFSEELGCLEGVGESGRGAVTRLEQFPNLLVIVKSMSQGDPL
jgi:hypothetical protein